NKPDDAARALVSAFVAMRKDPWATIHLAEDGLSMVGPISRQSPAALAPLLGALEEPFAVGLLNEHRLLARFSLALREGRPPACLRALAPMEPWVPFTRALLTARAQCCRRAGDARAADAERDLDAFLELTPIPLDLGLKPTSTQARPSGG